MSKWIKSLEPNQAKIIEKDRRLAVAIAHLGDAILNDPSHQFLKWASSLIVVERRSLARQLYRRDPNEPNDPGKLILHSKPSIYLAIAHTANAANHRQDGELFFAVRELRLAEAHLRASWNESFSHDN
jgi:hypothetical protein